MLYLNHFRRRLMLLAVLLLAVVGAVATAPAHAAVADGVYGIHTGASNWAQVLDVENGSPNANAGVQQWDANSQRWGVTHMGTDARGPYYRLVPQHSPTMCLDVPDALLGSGVRVQIWHCQPNARNQQFYLPKEPFGNPDIGKIVPRHSLRPLGIDGVSRGADLVQRANWDLMFAHQWFAFHRIS